MRLWILPITAMGLFAFGCNKSPEGGTPGTHATFKLSLPVASSDVKQGDKRTLDASIDRGSDFKQDVSLKVDSPPKVAVTLDKSTIKASESDTKFTITVAPEKDAPLGDLSIKVTATPAGGGAPTSNDFKVKVIGH